MNKNKLIFYTVWLGLMSLAPITILLNTSIPEALKYPTTTINLIQRLLGLWAYTMLFVQIILGSFMSKLADRFGGWIYTFHVIEGISVYFLILLHPTMFVLFNYFAGKGFDPIYVFIQICIICERKIEIYYSLARVAFWFLALSVGAGFFRTTTPFLRKHWKKFHILNFFSFILIGIHSLGVGSDIGSFPFNLFHGPALVTGIGIAIYKLVWRPIQKAQKPDEIKKN